MAKFNFYGRQIAKVLKSGKVIYVKSGQWVGHKAYGKKNGTERQRQILLKNCEGEKILGISVKVFWKLTGFCGEIIDQNNKFIETCKLLEYKVNL